MLILGESPSIRRLRQRIKSVASTNATVLVLGPTGCGKELVAREIHRQSQRVDKPFVAVNCAAIPPQLIESELFGHIKGAFTGASHRSGKFLAAHEGTLFLDEIGELDPRGQACLLRVLDEHVVTPVGSNTARRVDVRLISATNRDLTEFIRDGRFREDLYHRMNVVAIRLPALKERRNDIPILANHALRLFAETHGKKVHAVSAEVMRILQEYAWPGNVRELQNVIEAAVIQAARGVLTPHDLPPLQPSAEVTLTLVDAEKRAIEKALVQARGKKTEAAKLLGCSRKHIWQVLKRTGN